MSGRVIARVALAVVLLIAVVGIGVSAYDAGMAQGIAQGAQTVAPQPGAIPAPYYGGYGGYYGPHAWGWGFGFLGLLFPLFFLFLFFSLIRGLFGWRRGGWGGWHGYGYGDGRQGVPPMFEEWHRRAHEPPTDA